MFYHLVTFCFFIQDKSQLAARAERKPKSDLRVIRVCQQCFQQQLLCFIRYC
jgi:hypothetical protein